MFFFQMLIYKNFLYIIIFYKNIKKLMKILVFTILNIKLILKKFMFYLNRYNYFIFIEYE